MADASITNAVIQAADLKSLELLYDYTKFHIGLYLTLASGFITLANVKKGEGFLLDLHPSRVYRAMACFLIAGLAGGVIISSITQCYGLPESNIAARCTSSEALLTQKLGPWQLELVSGRIWTWIEHTSFWAGLLFALFAFSVRRDSTPAKELLAVRVEGAIRVLSE